MKSINKALIILEAFLTTKKSEMRLVELSEITGYNRSTVNRIVAVLAEHGYLNQKEKWGKYSLGTKFLSFSGVIKRSSKINEVARPYLINLFDIIQESIMLATWDGKAAVYREIIESSHPLKIVPDEGTFIPLHCTSIGKLVLANDANHTLLNTNNVRLKSYTENSITDVNILKNQLIKIAKENIAYDDEECFNGARSVSSGIKDSTGEIVACVGVFGPTIRLTRHRMTEIAPEVKKCAEEISKALGYLGAK